MTLAILVSAFLCFGLGFIWYAPGVFGNAWIDAVGKKPKDLEPAVSRHAISIVGWLAASFVYAFLLSQGFLRGVQDYMFLSIALWGAYMLPPKAMSIMQGNFNTKLLWIDGGYQLAGYLLMAMVFAILV